MVKYKFILIKNNPNDIFGILQKKLKQNSECNAKKRYGSDWIT